MRRILLYIQSSLARLAAKIGSVSRAAIVAAVLVPVVFCGSSGALAQEKVPVFRSAATARAWGEARQANGQFQQASEAYLQEAALRAEQGDLQGAEVRRRLARRLGTDIALAIPTPPPAKSPYPLAKWEPGAGCYVGALDTPGEGRSFDGESDADDFSRRIGEPLAFGYTYLRYSDSFPERWAERNAEAGRAIQIAMEPNNIYAVQDDDYLENWARDAARFPGAVFLRFGGEMNGAWTPWHADPLAYRKAFRLVAQVMKRIAPNVAMVWAPNDVPTDNLDRYYPGDDVVDWIGISLYLVRYYDDNRLKPAYQDNPATFIEPFYAKYAGRKPLCLVECGVTHNSHVEGAPSEQFAATRIRDLLSAIKVRFPRLKMFCWFDRNNLAGASPDRRLNDYSLPRDSPELAAFQVSVADPYFLTRVDAGTAAEHTYTRVITRLPPQYTGVVDFSLRTYSLMPGLRISRGGHTTRIPPGQRKFALPAGTGPVTLSVIDNSNRIAATYKISAP